MLTFRTCWLPQAASKKGKRADDEYDMADMSDLQPRARSGRAAASKRINYHFDTDDDDDDDEDDM